MTISTWPIKVIWPFRGIPAEVSAGVRSWNEVGPSLVEFKDRVGPSNTGFAVLFLDLNLLFTFGGDLPNVSQFHLK